MAGRSMGPTTKKPDGTVEKAPSYLCPYCGKTKKEGDFYVSSDPLVLTGRVSMCKECAEKIARNYNKNTKQFADCTRESICSALERLDKPFIQKLWEASISEVHDPTLQKHKTSLWAAYIKNVQMPQYRAMRWRDGDLFNDTGEISNANSNPLPQDPEVLEEYRKNKKDVIRLIGYDPFDKEADEDKPLLYAQLRGYLDADGNNDDQTRVLDCIEIVRGYLQLQKVNDMSARAFANLGATGQSGEIKNYMDTKKKIADVISQLAEQSCISMKHNKNAKKGEDTWTGKIKKLKDINLREAEVNGFDIGTCRGMQQVLDLSNASIIRQLRLDESEYSDMIAEQRELIVRIQKEKDVYQEISRILLRENIDLKDLLNEHGLLSEENLVDLGKLFSPFGEVVDNESSFASEDEGGVEDE